MEKTRKILKFILEYLLDTIAPPDLEVRKIEQMSPEIFLEETSKTPEIGNIPEVLHFLPYRSLVVKTAILEIKTHENRKMALLLAHFLYDFLLPELSDLELFKNFTRPILIPIPMTKRKKRKRGFNQCELIAQAIKKIDKSDTFEIRTDILVKTRDTDDQKSKTREERFKNMQNCFRVRKPEAVKDRNVIIFDDVATTGATLSESSRVLKETGAKNIICVSLTH